jgi:hypothetical protein
MLELYNNLFYQFKYFLSVTANKKNVNVSNCITNKWQNDCLHTDFIFVQTIFHPHGHH